MYSVMFKLKKRLLIAVVVTILIIIATNKFWLVFKPIPVDFDILGKGQWNIKVVFNKKNDSKFLKVREQALDFNLDEVNHLAFDVKIKKPKKIRFEFVYKDSASGIPSELEILSGVQLRYGKLKLDDLNKFNSKDAELKITDDKLIIYPKTDTITLDYDDNLKIRSAVKFDFEIFVIILVLTFLFSYKISNYVADFKTIENKSRIDIIFLTIFFIFLFIPMLHINQDEYSMQENRTLAKWKPFITENGEINYDFGRDFNAWFNDRFNHRASLVKLYTNLKYFLSNDYYEVKHVFLNKKTKWMCDKPPAKEIITEKDKKEIISNIKSLYEFCKDNNIKTYIIITPKKYEIYNKELTPFINIPNNYEVKHNLFNEIQKELGVEIIYPYQELKELSRKSFAYFKTDHHWTDEGAYLAYLKVMEQIKKDFLNIYINQEKDFNYIYSNKVRVQPDSGFHNGYTYYQFNKEDKSFFDINYKYFEHKHSDKLIYKHSFNIDKQAHYFEYEYNKSAPNMVLFGDSFTLNLLPTIVYSFNKTKNIYTWVNGNNELDNFNIDKHETEIIETNPQILIICLSDIFRLKYLFRENN